MRLIDADTIDFSKAFGGSSSFMRDMIAKAQNLIDVQPTAFDKEKVLDELRQEAMYELGVPEEEFDLDEGEYSAYCSIPFSQAKKIIEKGGME